MSKLLKVIVNTLLLLAILSAGALVIPPFAGITTLVSDGMGPDQQRRADRAVHDSGGGKSAVL